jgi:transposase
MRLRIELTTAQVIALREQVRSTRNADSLRRAIALIELNQRRPWWELTSLLQVSLRTLYRWAEELEHHAMAAATGESVTVQHGGRPSRWDEELDELLDALLCHRPDQLGLMRTSWSVPALQAHLEHWSGEHFSDDTIRRRLHALGYAWKRPRYILVPDPMRDKKIKEIQVKMKDLKPRQVLLCMDETDLLLFPPLRSAWSLRGESARVKISGWNEKRVIYGAMNVQTGHLILLARERHQAIDFQVFLHTIVHHYRGWEVILLLDGHPSHKAASSEVVARTLGVSLWWLPKRSPELNPMDSLWGKAKDLLSANRQYEDIEDQTDAFISTLESLPEKKILKLSGLQSDKHWLRIS